MDFHAKATFSVANKMRPLDSQNVVARLEGSDSALKDQVVIYSAHWDHLGVNPKRKGDQIYNGAADNASGCAGLLEIARKFAGLQGAERPRRSILFLAVTAEEQGLLGSEYYAQHPLYPLAKTLADINIDGMQLAGPSRDIEVVGDVNSSLDDLADVPSRQRDGRVMGGRRSSRKREDFYRSDQFEFAKVGVPAFYTKSGVGVSASRLRKDAPRRVHRGSTSRRDVLVAAHPSVVGWLAGNLGARPSWRARSCPSPFRRSSTPCARQGTSAGA